MAQVLPAFDQTSPSPDSRLMLALPVMAGLLAVLATQNLVWAFSALMGVAALLALVKWPEASTLTVVFILYSNMASVAVEFHGVPLILAASFLSLLVIPLLYYVIM